MAKRFSKNTPILVILAVIAMQLSFIGLWVFVAQHFIRKFW